MKKICKMIKKRKRFSFLAFFPFLKDSLIHNPKFWNFQTVKNFWVTVFYRTFLIFNLLITYTVPYYYYLFIISISVAYYSISTVYDTGSYEFDWRNQFEIGSSLAVTGSLILPTIMLSSPANRRHIEIQTEAKENKKNFAACAKKSRISKYSKKYSNNSEVANETIKTENIYDQPPIYAAQEFVLEFSDNEAQNGAETEA